MECAQALGHPSSRIAGRDSMPRRIAIIQGHPDLDERRFCRALAQSYAEGALAAGHTVTRIDLAALSFPLLHSEAEFKHGPVPAALIPAQRAIIAAEHIILV